MDVYAAAGAMVAFSDFAVASAKCVYGDTAQTAAKVYGFREGSFIAQIAVQVGLPTVGLFASDIEQLYGAIRGAFDLWKHLQGKPPKSTSKADNNSVSVVNHDGRVSIFNNSSVTIVFDEKAASSAKAFVADPLSWDGMDAVDVTADTKDIPFHLVVPRDEAHWYGPIERKEQITDYTVRTGLSLEAAVFKDKNKWRFFDGSASFSADMLDEDFLKQVDMGARFGKGDILIVDMQVIQCRTGDKLSTERRIIKVVEHQEHPTQQKLFPPDSGH
jgi:hypothetical protein